MLTASTHPLAGSTGGLIDASLPSYSRHSSPLARPPADTAEEISQLRRAVDASHLVTDGISDAKQRSVAAIRDVTAAADASALQRAIEASLQLATRVADDDHDLAVAIGASERGRSSHTAPPPDQPSPSPPSPLSEAVADAPALLLPRARSTPFAVHACRLGARWLLLDCGGGGACGSKSLAAVFRLLGVSALDDLGLRAAVVQAASTLISGADHLTWTALLASSMDTWPVWACRGLGVSAPSWIQLMVRRETWVDDAFLTVAAVLFKVEIVVDQVGRDGALVRTHTYAGPHASKRARIVLVNGFHYVARVLAGATLPPAAVEEPPPPAAASPLAAAAHGSAFEDDAVREARLARFEGWGGVDRGVCRPSATPQRDRRAPSTDAAIAKRRLAARPVISAQQEAERGQAGTRRALPPAQADPPPPARALAAMDDAVGQRALPPATAPKRSVRWAALLTDAEAGDAVDRRPKRQRRLTSAYALSPQAEWLLASIVAGAPTSSLRDPGEPEILVPFAYSGRVARCYERAGFIVLQVDLRANLGKCWHHVGDAIPLLRAKRWRLVVAFPPCTHTALSGAPSFPAKIADGRHWWGCATVLACLCSTAARVAVEQPRSAFARYYRQPDQKLQPWMLGEGDDGAPGEQKEIWLFLQGQLTPLTLLRTSPASKPVARLHNLYITDPDERDRARSLTLWSTAGAIAAQIRPGDEEGQPLDWSEEVARLRDGYVRWHGAHCLPQGHDDILNAPSPSAHRAPPEDTAPTVALAALDAPCTLLGIVARRDGAEPLLALPSDGTAFFGDAIVKGGRDPACSTGEQWARRLLRLEDVDSFLGGVVLDADAADREVRHRLVSVVVALADVPHVTELRWCEARDIRCQRLSDIAHAAVEAARCFWEPRPALPANLVVGVGGDREVVSDIASESTGVDFATRLARATRAQVSLDAALRAVTGPPELERFLADFADRLGPIDVSDIPENLRAQSLSFDTPKLRTRPFPHTSVVPYTPSVRPPRPPPRFPAELRPQRDEDIFDPTFIAALDLWMARYEAYHAARLDGQPANRPEPFAWDETAVLPPYRGCFIDFRGGVGRICALDPEAAAVAEYAQRSGSLRAALAGTIDASVVDLWADGVDFQADMPHGCVIHPNLVNFWDDVHASTTELDAFTACGWMSGSGESTPPEGRCRLPTFPFYAQPHGQVAKKLGSKPRIIIDMGAPRKPLRAQPSGARVPSLNDRAGPMHPPKWPREVKPSAAEGAEATAILMSAAEPAGLPCFEVAFDWAKYFHQFGYKQRQACVAGAVVPALIRDSTSGATTVSRSLTARSVYVMAMGATPASEIAQRGSNATNARLYARMDEAEAELLPLEEPSVRRWMAARRAMKPGPYGTEARLLDLRTFADDPRAVIVGVTRTVRFLTEVWDLTSRLMHLVFASPSKWSIGGVSTWVGISFSAMLGVLWLPRVKALKALAYIDEALDNVMTAGTWRRMMGLFEHVVSVLRLHRYRVDRLWRPLNAGGPLALDGPGATVTPDAEERRLLVRMREVVTSAPGASLLACVRPAPRCPMVTTWDLRGDAALEAGDPTAGLGGHLYHIWCYMALTPLMRERMAISHLEFLQACMLFITHAERRLRHVALVRLEVDALASPTVLARHARRSPRMRAIHELFMLHPLFVAFTQPSSRLITRHRWGAANPVGDAASRLQLTRLARHMRQMGLVPARIEYSAAAHQFRDAVLEHPAFAAQSAAAASAPMVIDVRGPPGPAPTSPPTSPPSSPTYELEHRWGTASPMGDAASRLEHPALAAHGVVAGGGGLMADTSAPAGPAPPSPPPSPTSAPIPSHPTPDDELRLALEHATAEVPRVRALSTMSFDVLIEERCFSRMALPLDVAAGSSAEMLLPLHAYAHTLGEAEGVFLRCMEQMLGGSREAPPAARVLPVLTRLLALNDSAARDIVLSYPMIVANRADVVPDLPTAPSALPTVAPTSPSANARDAADALMARLQESGVELGGGTNRAALLDRFEAWYVEDLNLGRWMSTYIPTFQTVIAESAGLRYAHVEDINPKRVLEALASAAATGGQCEVDRRVAEALASPLWHAVYPRFDPHWVDSQTSAAAPHESGVNPPSLALQVLKYMVAEMGARDYSRLYEDARVRALEREWQALMDTLARHPVPMPAWLLGITHSGSPHSPLPGPAPPSAPPSPGGPRRSSRTRAEAPESELPPAASRLVYDERGDGGHRLAECTWRPADGRAAATWLKRWVPDWLLERTALPISVVFVDLQGAWAPWYVVAESASIPGQLGMFLAAQHESGSRLALMSGELLEGGAARTSRYLFWRRHYGQRRYDVLDSAHARHAGPQRANDPRGLTGLTANAILYEDGWLCLKAHRHVLAAAASMTLSQWRRAEVLYSYGPAYWALHDRSRSAAATATAVAAGTPPASPGPSPPASPEDATSPAPAAGSPGLSPARRLLHAVRGALSSGRRATKRERGQSAPPSPSVPEHEPAPAARTSLGPPPSPRAMRRLEHQLNADDRMTLAMHDRAASLADAARTDASVFALKPGSPDRLRRLFLRVGSFAQRAAPRTTLSQEDSNMRHWRAVCAEMGTSEVRPSVSQLHSAGGLAFDIECAFWADALFLILDRMHAEWLRNPKGRAHPPKPSSALQVLRGVRRVHVKRYFVQTVPLTVAVAVCDGLLRQYAETHGPEALVPQRKEPLTREIILRMLELDSIPLGGGRSAKRDTLAWLELQALIQFMAQCGFRKAEVSVASGVAFGLMHLSMANVVWKIHAVDPDGFIQCPTAEQLAMLAPGDYAVIRPPPSKADQLGIFWAADPIWLPFEPEAEICAARALAAAEIRRGVTAQQRRSSPLFVDGSGGPLRHQQLDAMFPLLLEAAGVPRSETSKYSWHSFRIHLACALLAAGKDAATIQCMLRWKSPEALRLYARFNAEVYAGHLRDAAGADITSVRTTHSHDLPPLDVDARVAAAREDVEAMYRDAEEDLGA